jgi:hypothetical protein
MYIPPPPPLQGGRGPGDALRIREAKLVEQQRAAVTIQNGYRAHIQRKANQPSASGSNPGSSGGGSAAARRPDLALPAAEEEEEEEPVANQQQQQQQQPRRSRVPSLSMERAEEAINEDLLLTAAAAAAKAGSSRRGSAGGGGSESGSAGGDENGGSSHGGAHQHPMETAYTSPLSTEIVVTSPSYPKPDLEKKAALRQQRLSLAEARLAAPPPQSQQQGGGRRGLRWKGPEESVSASKLHHHSL